MTPDECRIHQLSLQVRKLEDENNLLNEILAGLRLQNEQLKIQLLNLQKITMASRYGVFGGKDHSCDPGEGL